MSENLYLFKLSEQPDFFCNEKNAEELFSKPDVDGGLIGGASLVAEKFVAIINAR